MQILARLLQPAAEDKNEERASMFAVLAPIPPEQLDKEDWSHTKLLVKSTFRIDTRVLRRWVSQVYKRDERKQGTVLMIYSIFGIGKTSCSKGRASCFAKCSSQGPIIWGYSFLSNCCNSGICVTNWWAPTGRSPWKESVCSFLMASWIVCAQFKGWLLWVQVVQNRLSLLASSSKF